MREGCEGNPLFLCTRAANQCFSKLDFSAMLDTDFSRFAKLLFPVLDRAINRDIEKLNSFKNYLDFSIDWC